MNSENKNKERVFNALLQQELNLSQSYFAV